MVISKRILSTEFRKIHPFLEMLDQLNEQLLAEGIEPVVFDHDCREGICGMCSLTINGLPHGPEDSTTTCQLHMRINLAMGRS